MPAFADVMEWKRAAAIEPYEQMSAMDPGDPMARLFYIWALILNERVDAARAVLELFPSKVRDTVPARIADFLVRAAVANGRAAPPRPPDIDLAATAGDVFPRMLAQGHALAGMPDDAIRCLRVAIDRGFINYPFLAHHDPFFEPIRGLSSFHGLMDLVRDGCGRSSSRFDRRITTM